MRLLTVRCTAAVVKLPCDYKNYEVAEQLAMTLTRAFVLCTLILVLGATAQAPDEGYSREQLQPLTKFRHNNMHEVSHVRQAVHFHGLRQAAAQEDHRSALSLVCVKVCYVTLCPRH